MPLILSISAINRLTDYNDDDPILVVFVSALLFKKVLLFVCLTNSKKKLNPSQKTFWDRASETPLTWRFACGPTMTRF